MNDDKLVHDLYNSDKQNNKNFFDINYITYYNIHIYLQINLDIRVVCFCAEDKLDVKRILKGSRVLYYFTRLL